MTLKEIVEELKLKVSLERFNPVEKIVYGATGIILIGALTMLLNLIYKK